MEQEITLNKKCALQKAQIFNGATLKLIACALMLIDHIGFIFLDAGSDIYYTFRGVGRLAFPIFAFFIAEGCKYTKNKFRHFAFMFSAGVICEVFIVIFTRQFIGNIFLTFSISTALIYLLEKVKRSIFERQFFDAILGTIALVSAIIALNFAFEFSLVTPILLRPQKFTLDYGFYGVLAPVAVSLFDFKRIESAPDALKKLDSLPIKLLALSLAIFPLTLLNNNNFDNIQLLQYVSIPLLLLYNGKKGFNIKYFFYVFYPLHMVVLYGLNMII